MFWLFCCLDAGILGEGERLRFAVGAFAESEEEVVAEVEERLRLVFAVEVACSVALESLDVGLREEFEFLIVGVRSGGLEKSTSEELSEELASEDEDESGVAILMVVAASGASMADSLFDDDVSDDEDGSAKDVGRAPLAGFSDIVVADFISVLTLAFLSVGAVASLAEDSAESDDEFELEVPLKLAVRFKLLPAPFTIGSCKVAGVGGCVSSGSSSSSASLSELGPEVDCDDDFAFDPCLFFLIGPIATAASSISTADSLSSSLLSVPPLLLVSSFAMTLATASSLALAPALACFFALFDVLASLAPELSSESLPLPVSSIFVVFLYVSYHSL